MATYTTASLVRKRAENLDATLVDADINAYIETAEAALNAIMGTSFVSSFSLTKHGILRIAAEAFAARCAILFNPVGFTSLQEAQVMVSVLESDWERTISMLKDKGIIAYLESL